ncbi:unnamed protein product [Rotaria sp. Silwood2]|nr:unnamed protein product [Rotaria sp. Silwood2]
MLDWKKTISTASFSFQTTTVNRQQTLQDYVDDENQATSSLVPVVLLVIQDDLDTVEQVHEAVVQNNIPVVLLEGIGTCSDLFAI